MHYDVDLLRSLLKISKQLERLYKVSSHWLIKTNDHPQIPAELQPALWYKMNAQGCIQEDIWLNNENYGQYHHPFYNMVYKFHSVIPGRTTKDRFYSKAVNYLLEIYVAHYVISKADRDVKNLKNHWIATVGANDMTLWVNLCLVIL